MMKREVFFMEEIRAVNIDKLIQEIQKMRDSGDEAITLFLCSPGGTASPAVGFYDWIKVEKINLTIIAIGQVSSAALYILLSGTKRKALAHSVFMMHPGGRAREKIERWLLRLVSPRLYREDVEFDAILTSVRMGIFIKETKLSPMMVKEFLTRRHLAMTPAQAMEKGFISEILT